MFHEQNRTFLHMGKLPFPYKFYIVGFYKVTEPNALLVDAHPTHGRNCTEKTCNVLEFFPGNLGNFHLLENHMDKTQKHGKSNTIQFCIYCDEVSSKASARSHWKNHYSYPSNQAQVDKWAYPWAKRHLSAYLHCPNCHDLHSLEGFFCLFWFDGLLTNQKTWLENFPRFCTKRSFAHSPFHHLDLTIPIVDTNYWFLFVLKWVSVPIVISREKPFSSLSTIAVIALAISSQANRSGRDAIEWGSWGWQQSSVWWLQSARPWWSGWPWLPWWSVRLSIGWTFP